jgi:outer membrane immunogenic protein
LGALVLVCPLIVLLRVDGLRGRGEKGMVAMKPTMLAAAACAACLIGATEARATDPHIQDSMATVSSDAANADDWEGFYFGLLGTFYTEGGISTWGATKVAGWNVVDGQMLYGVEVAAQALVDPLGPGALVDLDVLGRLGFLAGDDVVIYGAGGAGFNIGGGSYGLLGGGVDFALGDSAALRGAYSAVLWGPSVGHRLMFGVTWNPH